jgi:hypothetical protein
MSERAGSKVVCFLFHQIVESLQLDRRACAPQRLIIALLLLCGQPAFQWIV